MSEREGGRASGPGEPTDLPVVAERISELQRRKRGTVRWHMSRDTAERAIAAITQASRPFRPGRGKSRRRKRHKRLL
jgi:hypothetical protein